LRKIQRGKTEKMYSALTGFVKLPLLAVLAREERGLDVGSKE